MQLNQIRRDYKHAKLNENSILKNPIQQFKLWMDAAIEADLADSTAMSLVSIGSDGFPQSRIVLLKNYDNNGFTFFTNYDSEKGKAIAKNKKVSLHFFWSGFERQIRITGYAQKTDAQTSRDYFYSRPIKSQIAASISNQSSVVASRIILENKFNQLSEKLKGEKLSMPINWGGYIVEPIKFEFWQGRASRLHDRIIYERERENWIIKRLAP